MSKDWYQDIVEFHDEIMGDVFPKKPYLANEKLAKLRIELIREEFGEIIEAVADCNIVAIADGIADLLYVVIGMAVTYGIDIRPVWDEVHRSNMTKKGGEIRVDGKLIKPEWHSPADIESVLRGLSENE